MYVIECNIGPLSLNTVWSVSNLNTISFKIWVVFLFVLRASGESRKYRWKSCLSNMVSQRQAGLRVVCAQEKQASLNQSILTLAFLWETSLWQYLFSSRKAIKKYLRTDNPSIASQVWNQHRACCNSPYVVIKCRNSHFCVAIKPPFGEGGRGICSCSQPEIRQW